MSASRVVDVEAIPLVTGRGPGDLDAGNETVLVRVTDEDGRVGVGESDAPARIVQELVDMDDLFEWSRGLRSIVVGLDPFELAANHARMLRETQYHGRRGLGVHAVSAVDMALYDLAGKQLERPAYQLLGGACRTALRPYATIWPGSPNGRTIGEMMDVIAEQFERALALGFRALKMEVVFRDLVNDRELEQCVREGRRLLGPDIAMLVDFGYRWTHWRDAARVLTRLENCDIFLAEATVQHDDLDGHARLARAAPMRIAGAEFAATVQECREWLSVGTSTCCSRRQPLRRSHRAAADRRARVAPWGGGRAARLEDRHHGRRAEAFPGRHPVLSADRDVPSRPLRLDVARVPDRPRGGHLRWASPAAGRAGTRRRRRRGSRRPLPHPGGSVMTHTATRAAVLRAFGEPQSIEDVELRPPGPGEARVRILAAGSVTATWVRRRGSGPARSPSCSATKAPESSRRWARCQHAVGTRVVLSLAPGCGACAHCHAGSPIRCQAALAAMSERRLTTCPRRSRPPVARLRPIRSSPALQSTPWWRAQPHSDPQACPPRPRRWSAAL